MPSNFSKLARPGKYWTFAAQCEPLADVNSLRGYTDWMQGLLSFMPDGRYEVMSFATDEQRHSVCAYGVFSATHPGEGGPLSPTGRHTTNDYVYVMQFDGDTISRMTKTRDAPWAIRELGWA